MRFIDKTGCKSAFEKGKDTEIQSLASSQRPPAASPRRTNSGF